MKQEKNLLQELKDIIQEKLDDRVDIDEVYRILTVYSSKLLLQYSDELDLKVDSHEHDEFVVNLIAEYKEPEKTHRIRYGALRRKMSWEKFCDITGTNYYAINEGGQFDDSDTYEIPESIVEKYNL